MKSAKKTKAPKKLRKVKPAKSAIKKPLTKEEKRLVKLTRKDLIERGRLINKRVSTMVGFLAVLLTAISSVLDVLLSKKDKKSHNKKG